MIHIKNKADCSGCHACYNVCPKQCISMVQDKEGFLYPQVDTEKCVDCGLCDKVCPTSKPFAGKQAPAAYACYNLDEEIRVASSSGGIFTLFAEKILALGGVVFGAAFDENLDIIHICVDKKEDLSKLRGSKYVQSAIGDSYKQAKVFLEAGRPVLFTGTPCQVHGLQLYLGKDYDHLYTQDIVCHGVPSPKLWRKYLQHLEAQQESAVDRSTPPSFRDKVSGWLKYSITVHFQNGTTHTQATKKDPYLSIFLSDKALRPSCYRSSCKGLRRNSDITLADFWGVNKLLPEFFDNKGTSLLFVNTEKGRRLFAELQPLCRYQEVSLTDAVKHNRSAYAPVPRPLDRKKIMKMMDCADIETLKRACLKQSPLDKLWCKVQRKLYRKK